MALLLGLLGAGVGAGVAAAIPAGTDGFLDDAVERTGMPGAAVAITRDGVVQEVRGIGVDGHGRPVTADTRFRIASLSKSFTAVAVLRLVDAGRIAPDRPVRDYLPDFTTRDPARSDRITVRQLLNQTSGLSDLGYPGITRDEPSTVAERAQALRTARTVAEPGREFHYFDPNYQLLARVVEVATGRPFAEVLRAQVLVPLGMSRTVSVDRAQDAAALPGFAGGHVLAYGRSVTVTEQDGLLSGSGGVISTASDMARWLSFQTTGRPALLRPDTFALMHTPANGDVGGYAMGWQRPAADPGRLEHNGVLSTFSADQVLVPRTGLGVALLYDGHAQLADTTGVRDGLLALLSGRPPPDVRATAPVALAIGVLTVLVLGWRIVALRGVGRWPARRGTPLRRVPGLALPAVPLVLLAALPAIVAFFADRSFTLGQLALAMPEVVVLFAVAGSSGAALVVCRARAVRAIRR